MPKRLFYIVGVLIGFLIGFLFGEVLRRKRMERLATLEEQQAARHAYLAKSNERWKEYISTLSPEEKITWALREAGLEMEMDEWERNYDDDAQE